MSKEKMTPPAPKGQDRTPEQRAADHARANMLAAWDATAPLIRRRYDLHHPIGRELDTLDGLRQSTGEPPAREVIAALDLLAESIHDELTGEGELRRGWRSHEAIASAEWAFMREVRPEPSPDARLAVIVRGLARAIVDGDGPMLDGMAELAAEGAGR